MTRLTWMFALAPLALALTGCPGLPLVGPEDGSVPLHFEAIAAGHGQWLAQPEISVAEAAGGLVVETRMSTADPCRRFEASAIRSGGRVTLSVRVEPNSPVCYAIVGTFRYTAGLSGLPAGTHRLTITHLMVGTGDPGPHTVFDDDVVVR